MFSFIYQIRRFENGNALWGAKRFSKLFFLLFLSHWFLDVFLDRGFAILGNKFSVCCSAYCKNPSSDSVYFDKWIKRLCTTLQLKTRNKKLIILLFPSHEALRGTWWNQMAPAPSNKHRRHNTTTLSTLWVVTQWLCVTWQLSRSAYTLRDSCHSAHALRDYPTRWLQQSTFVGTLGWQLVQGGFSK